MIQKPLGDKEVFTGLNVLLEQTQFSRKHVDLPLHLLLAFEMINLAIMNLMNREV